LTGLSHAADSLIGLDLNNNPIASVAGLYTYRYDIDYLRIEQVLSNAYKNQGFEPYPGTDAKPHFLLTINKFGALYHPFLRKGGPYNIARKILKMAKILE